MTVADAGKSDVSTLHAVRLPAAMLQFLPNPIKRHNNKKQFALEYRYLPSSITFS
jgi:hypothetical protein